MGAVEIILGLLGVVGIGGIITAAQAKQKEIEFKRLENKQLRYKSCLLYMDVYFRPANIKFLSNRQKDIDNAGDVLEYLRAEYHDMILYASRAVVLSVKAFIEEPTRERFVAAVIAMREDLWAKGSDLAVAEVMLPERGH